MKSQDVWILKILDSHDLPECYFKNISRIVEGIHQSVDSMSPLKTYEYLIATIDYLISDCLEEYFNKEPYYRKASLDVERLDKIISQVERYIKKRNRINRFEGNP